MSISLETAKVALEILLIVGNVLVIAFLAYMRSSFVAKKEYEDRDAHIQGRMAGFDLRIANIEGKLPDAKEWREIAVSISELRGDIELVGSQCKNLEGLVERVEASIARQEQYIHDLKG